VRQALAARGYELPELRYVMTLGSTQAVVSAVDAGIGIGFVTARALAAHRPGRLAAIRLKGVPIVRDLFLVYETARSRPPQVEAFIRFVAPPGPQDDAGT
jgi:DNA-binding transcriptional LysR family regulator